MTFHQYLENIRTWNTKNPQADINVTADYSDDENDSSYFLIPFMRKIKAFCWYCRVAANEITYRSFRWSPEDSRRKDDQDFRFGGRIAGIHNIVGYGEPMTRDHPVRQNLSHLASQFEDFYRQLNRVVSGIKSHSVEVEFHYTLTCIDAVLHHYSSGGTIDKIKAKIERMRLFLEQSKEQLFRVIKIKSSGNMPFDLYGRKRNDV